ncbi:MAG: DUF368 domain-containing protein [Planctomycetaceae bacterium]|nr:DUF368 domain-containing protein [Planctomycetaceae bacterium]
MTDSNSTTQHLRTAGCGFLMGAADTVPGVSGGTVALILGVYQRLVTAISQCNAEFARLLLQRRWKDAADHIDVKFVLALGTGILSGVAGLVSLMNYLLTNQMSLTFATFTGMILASSLLVSRRITRWQIQHYGMLLLGMLFALWLVTLPALKNPPDTLWYMFLCGMIGITAMILPGISGAFILLLMNRYTMITESIRDTLKGNLSLDVIASLGIFAAGCLVGLLSFSRVLRWLLSKHHDGTMAVLCGFMLGSLYKLWPFQQDTTPDIVKFKQKVFVHYLPNSVDGHLLAVFSLCAVGVAVVLVLDAVSADEPVDGAGESQAMVPSESLAARESE